MRLSPSTENASVFAVAAKLRVQQFEAAILFPNSLRAALEAWLAGIPRRVGYPWTIIEPLLLNQIPRGASGDKAAAPPRHQAHQYLALAEYIGADIDDIRPLPAAPLHGRDAAAPLILGICPGAEYGPAKRWLPERFAEVMLDI